MNFEEYQLTGRATYAAFVDAIRTILVSLVDKHGFTPHAITGRAKDPASLKNKLAKNKIHPSSAIEEMLKDLAGCRIVFLTNSQVAAFRATGAINENFDILNVNEHHPVPGTETEDRLFDSTNYTVALKPDRAALPEYARFAGLKAEIQVQTLLNHAWAEMGHDTIYKEPELKHVDPRHMEAINARMAKVMRKHLLPAGYAFDKIARDFDRIIKADAAADETFSTIQSSTNNDELLGAFESADTLILPMIADNSEVFVKLVPQIASAVERVRGTQGAPIKSIMGDFPGKTGEIVAKRAADLIGRGLYVDPKLSFETITRLYRGAATDGERKVWTDLGARFADYTMEAWDKVGAGMQAFIVEQIGALGAEDRRDLTGLIVAMLAKVLSYEISGTRRGGFRTILFSTAAVPASEGLRKIRAGAFDILEQMLDAANDDAERRAMLGPLWIAATPPFNDAGEGLRIQVMADATRLATFLRDRVTGWGLELRRRTEVKTLRVHRNFRTVPDGMTENKELVAAHEKLVFALIALRDALNADPEFVLYKTLVGTDSVALKAWEEALPDFRGAAAWRKERFPEIAAEADPEKADAWIARVRRFLPMPANATDRLPLAEFVGALVQAHPGIGARFLYEMDPALQPVLVRLLHGLDAAGQDDIIRQHVERFIGEGRFLVSVCIWLARRDQIDVDLLTTVADRARELGDPDAVLEAVNAAGHLYKRAADQKLIDRVFLPSVEHFRGSKDAFWNDRLMDEVDAAIVEGLDESQSRSLLELFVPVPDIDYSGDLILTVIARRFPALVLDYFGARIVRDATSDPMRYEVIPYHIHALGAVLAENPRRLLAATREWYRKDPRFHEYRGGRLFHNVFPELTDEALKPLCESVAKGDRDDLAFVLDTLAAYDGAEEIFPICMDVVERLDAGDEMLGRVSHVLGERGVLTGDYGSVEADRAEHANLAQWLDDPRDKVKAFAKEERRRIAQSMAQEQRRATGDVEHMKQDWGEPEVEAKHEEGGAA
jgi:ppGpp synthetase/RelA/SpoT-type nucleotidyltranferase